MEALEQSVPRTVADVDEVFGNNQSLVYSSKFFKTWQAVVGVRCSCCYSMIPPTVTRRSSKSERLAPPKQQPQSVSACLDTVLYFWTWNGFGTDKCMACGSSLSTTTIWRGTTFPTTTMATCCTRGGISALQNSGILCFMPRKDGPLAFGSSTVLATTPEPSAKKMRAAVALHRGDILLFTDNFQRLMQHKAPSFATWSGQTAEQFMQCQRYPGTGRDTILMSEEFEAAKRLLTWVPGRSS